MGASLESHSPLIPVRHARLDPPKAGQSLKAGKSTATTQSGSPPVSKVQPCPTYPTPIPASKLESATTLYRNGRLLTLKSYLGSCTACRGRNVPCSLAHHDIHALSEVLEAHQSKFPKQEPNITQQKSLSSVVTTNAPKPGSPRLSGNTLVQKLSHLSLGQNKLSNSPVGDSLPKIQARGAQPLLTDSIKLSPSFAANRYESFRDGQLLVLGVFSRKGYICQHLDGLCKDAYKTSNALQRHFEASHFPYIRLSSPYRYMCSKCLVSNKDLSAYCQNCQAEKSIEPQICGKFIQASNQRIVNEPIPRFFNERDLDQPVSACTREPIIATMPGTEFADQYATPSEDMTTEDQILIQLTETNLPWKDLAIRFKEQTGRFMTISALQEMKKSLDERFLKPMQSDLPYEYAGDIDSIDTKLLKHEEDNPPFTSLQSDPPRWHASPSLKASTVPSDDPVERWAQSRVRRLIRAYKERNHDCWKPPSPDKNEFDTDSSQSEDETDCEDDHIPETPEDEEILEHISHVLHSKKLKGNKSLGSPVLDPINRAMVDHVMKDFWQIFHEEWSAGIRKCAETSSYSTNSSPSAHGSTPPTGKSGEKSNKRTRENDGDKQPGKDGGNPNKRQNTSGCPKQAVEEAKIFACPYRKHNARRYNHHSLKWRTCALTPLQTVARVKYHLHRNHRIYQCERCNMQFRDDQELKDHRRVPTCIIQEPTPAEGFDEVIANKLRCRKKDHPNQSEEDRWAQIYQLLFPGEEVPSPYFEPILEDATSSAEFAGYEQYWRQEIPRLFRQELEVVAQEEVVIIEARLRDRLVDIIRLCQDQAVSNYLNHRSSSAPGVARPEPDTEPTTSPIPPQSTSLPSSIGIALPSSITPEDYPVDGSDTLDQPLRNGNNPRTIPTSTPLEHRLRDARQNELSDSGYISTGSSFQDTPDIEMPSRPLPGVEPRSQMASPNVQPHQSVTSLTCHQGENTHDETFYGEMTISPYPIIDGPEWPFLLE